MEKMGKNTLIKVLTFILVVVFGICASSSKACASDYCDEYQEKRIELFGQFIFKAIRDNDLEKLKKVMFPEIDRVHQNKETFLTHAIKNRSNLEIVEYLLEQGADPNIRDGNCVPPLFHAIHSDNICIGRLLIKRGSDIGSKAYSDHRTALMETVEASNLDFCKLLIDHGAAIDIRDANGNTALMRSLLYDTEHQHLTRFDIALFLIKSGANTSVRNNSGETPLMHAALEESYREVLELLLSKSAEVNTTTYDGETVLHFAVRGNNIDAVKTLVIKGADLNAEFHGVTALGEATINNHIEISGFLKQMGAVFLGRNYLSSALSWAVIRNDFNRVKELFDKGASVNAKCCTGCSTVFQNAARGSSDRIISLLIRRGADIDAQDIMGNSALIIAASIPNRHSAMRLILKNGGDLNLANKYGETPLMSASASGNYEAVRLLVERGAYLDKQDIVGMTALMIASYTCDGKISQELTKAGADINKRNILNETAASIAMKQQCESFIVDLYK